MSIIFKSKQHKRDYYGRIYMIEEQIQEAHNKFEDFKKERDEIVKTIKQISEKYPGFNLGIEFTDKSTYSFKVQRDTIDLHDKKLIFAIGGFPPGLELVCHFNVRDFQDLSVNGFGAKFLEITSDSKGPNPLNGTATWEQYEQIRKDYVQRKYPIEELTKKSNDLNLDFILTSLNGSTLENAEFFFKYKDIRCSYLMMGGSGFGMVIGARTKKIGAFIQLDIAKEFVNLHPQVYCGDIHEQLEITEDVQKVISLSDETMKIIGKLDADKTPAQNHCKQYSKRYSLNKDISPKGFFDFTQQIIKGIGLTEYCFCNIWVMGDVPSADWDLVNSKTENKSLYAETNGITYSLKRQENLWHIDSISFKREHIGSGKIDALMQKLYDETVKETKEKEPKR